MTELFKHIQDFLANNNTPGNLGAIIFGLATVCLGVFNKFVKGKVNVLQLALLNKEKEVADIMDKMSKAMLCLSNMFMVTFGNSKIDVKTKLFLQEKHNEMFELLEGLEKVVKKEEVEIKPEVVEVKELKEEKSVLDKIKEDL